MKNKAFSKISLLIILVVVISGGIFLLQYLGTPKEEVKDETADWGTYRNEEYGYEIKYPNDWKTNTQSAPKWIDIATVGREEYLGGVGTPPKGNAWIMLTVFSPNEQFEEFEKKEENYGDPDSDESVQILSVKRLINEANTISIRVLMGYWKGDPLVSQYDQIFNQMFSTFKFLE